MPELKMQELPMGLKTTLHAGLEWSWWQRWWSACRYSNLPTHKTYSRLWVCPSVFFPLGGEWSLFTGAGWRKSIDEGDFPVLLYKETKTGQCASQQSSIIQLYHSWALKNLNTKSHFLKTISQDCIYSVNQRASPCKAAFQKLIPTVRSALLGT